MDLPGDLNRFQRQLEAVELNLKACAWLDDDPVLIRKLVAHADSFQDARVSAFIPKLARQELLREWSRVLEAVVELQEALETLNRPGWELPLPMSLLTLSLGELRRLAEGWVQLLRPSRGRPLDAARHEFELTVARELHAAGIEFTRYRRGTLARVLATMLDALEEPVPRDWMRRLQALVREVREGRTEVG